MSNKVHELIRHLMQKHSVLVQVVHVFVSHERFCHSQRVATLALEYALKYGVDIESAFLASIAHDVCREYSNSQLLRCARKAAVHVQPYERELPVLLHGKVARVIFQWCYPMSEEVYAAIATHTLGCEFPTMLQKLIYVCDALDGKRSMWMDAGGRTARQLIMAQKSMDEMLYALILHMERFFGRLHRVTHMMKQSIMHIHYNRKWCLRMFGNYEKK